MTVRTQPQIGIGRAQPVRQPATLLWPIFALVAAGLVIYSQTRAFAWDEGFHLLTAQLIRHGRRPYLDFVFSQTPLNAYWNAGWMAIFGESWRPVHAIAALCSTGAVLLTVHFVYSRFPVSRWRIAAALIAGWMAGLNPLVVRYGGIAQAYGLCLVAIVAAYRLAVLSVNRNTLWFVAGAGFFCGIAAGSSLLTAPVAPVLLLWILIYNRAGHRWSKAAAFVSGAAVALAPVAWLFLNGPRQVFFGILQYNLLYRGLEWPDATRNNFEVMISWIDSGPALLLLLLSAGGLLFVYFRSRWSAARKAEFYLCAWLSAALAVHISIAHPTFARYYVFTVPFLSILAAAGVYAAGSYLYDPERPWQPVLVLGLLLSLGLAKNLYDQWEDFGWTQLEKTAKKVSDVTARGQTLFADEAVYFLTRHSPPPGMEMRDSHKFRFPPAESAALHVMSQPELDNRVKAGDFDTLETCEENDYVAAHGYSDLYRHSAQAGNCTVFWGKNVGQALSLPSR